MLMGKYKSVNLEDKLPSCKFCLLGSMVWLQVNKTVTMPNNHQTKGWRKNKAYDL